MTAVELKTEIQQALDDVPEDLLPDVLDFVKKIQASPEKDIKLNKFINQILAEDKQLFKRLAEED